MASSLKLAACLSTNCLVEPCDCLYHVLHALIPPQSSASQRYNLRHRPYYSCHHAPHACQTLTLLRECSIKTNIRHYCVFADVRSVIPVFNKEVVRDTTVVSCSSRYSGHDRRVRCICYYETRPFLLLAHKRPIPFFYTYPHKKPLLH